MARWLFKEEPYSYSYADLARDGETTWSGVNNALAKQHLRRIQPGDRVLYYHTGSERAVVGEMEAAATPVDDATGVSVRVKAVRPWPRAVTLAEIKADPAFAGWELVRLPRLSVVPVTDAQWERLAALAGI